ncbi:MAG: hypothetical protein KY464_08210 [Gemmatimonadetes bacterium]|nr:hypothetical protein [Gemmatimonadota bacterium]
MSLKIMHSRLSRLAVAVLALGVAACDNPVGDEHEDHPVGFVVLNAQGQEVARFNGSAVTGQMSVARNSPTTFTVAAISEDGDRITVDGTVIAIQATVTAGSATATVQNQNQVVLMGNQAGTGAVEIKLFHEGHEEFKRPVALVVS